MMVIHQNKHLKQKLHIFQQASIMVAKPLNFVYVSMVYAYLGIFPNSQHKRSGVAGALLVSGLGYQLKDSHTYC